MLGRVRLGARASAPRFRQGASGHAVNLARKMSSSGPAAPARVEREQPGVATTGNTLPATFLRGGTSKGVFITSTSLPSSPNTPSSWDPIFLSIMGSPDPIFGRQLNGMGGGVSSLSKVMIISPPSPKHKEEGIDVEYTFAQVGVKDASVDYSGNCGNLSSMVGVYAVDERLCTAKRVVQQVAGGKQELLGTVRSFNTNTQKIIDTTFPISENGVPLLGLPQASVAGVAGKASKIILDFIDPAGARTGKLLPTRNGTDWLELEPSSSSSVHKAHASLVDATNPTVFVSFSELSSSLPMEDYIHNSEAAAQAVNPVLELIRQAGARKMGLDPSAKAQPKIALLRAPESAKDKAEGVDIVCYAISMGVLHKAIPMTVGLCLGVASKSQGTIAWDIVHGRGGEHGHGQRNLGSAENPKEPGLVRIRHPGGLVDVGAEFDEKDGGAVRSAKVVRTGRRLMKGVVWY